MTLNIAKCSALVWCAVSSFYSFAYAQTPTVALHPWQATAPNATALAYFTNLVDGARIETPFRATFGLSGGWGLAPISKPGKGKSGHHHLLINRDLPLDFKKALPFDAQYVHFGKGQMESVLTFEPGDYTLRLLLADDKHLPHFVYSKPIKITVTAKNKSIDPQSLVKKSIFMLNLPVDGKVKTPFRLQFHASGFNLAQAAQAETDTGRFRLTATSATGGKTTVLDMVNGHTEVWLSPPAGTYTFKLELVDNLNSAKLMAEPVTAVLAVN